jgi:hypothetical protein
MAKERVIRVTEQEESLVKLIRALDLNPDQLKKDMLLAAAAEPAQQPEQSPRAEQTLTSENQSSPQPDPQPVARTGMPCKRCDSTEYHMEQRGRQYGLYCENGHWQKWISKKERDKYM